MRTDVSFVAPDMSVVDACRWAVEHDAPVYLVGSRDRLHGSVACQQFDQWRASGKSGDPVGSLVDDSFVHAHADHPIDVVLDRLSQSGGVLPVVSRTEARRVEGVISWAGPRHNYLAARTARGRSGSAVRRP